MFVELRQEDFGRSVAGPAYSSSVAAAVESVRPIEGSQLEASTTLGGLIARQELTDPESHCPTGILKVLIAVLN